MPLVKKLSTIDKDIKPLSYLKYSHSDDAITARDRLNNYFANIDPSDQLSLKTRMNNDFEASYFELLNHAFFFKQKFEIIAHPSLPNIEKQPDYLMRKNGDSFYVECKHFRQLKDEKRTTIHLKNQVIGQLNKLTSKYYFIVIRILKIQGEVLPDMSAFFKNIQKRLNQMPQQNDEYVYPDYYDTIEYTSHQCRIQLALLIRDDENDGISMSDLVVAHINHPSPDVNIKSLKSGLIKKLVRYKLEDTPLLLSLNMADSKYFEASIFDSLFYGTPIAKHFPKDKNENTIRLKDGLFTKPGNNLDLIAGVLLFFGASPFRNHPFECRFFNNPSFKRHLQSLTLLDKECISINHFSNP